MTVIENKLEQALSQMGAAPSLRSRLHHKLTMKYLSPNERQTLQDVEDHLLNGSSHVKMAMSQGHTDMAEILYAIKNRRCITTPEEDLGHSYLENVIGSAIHSIYDGHDINVARRVFGMQPIALSRTA